MKSILLAVTAASCAAFAPSSTGKANTALNYAADLDNMIGVGPETGGRVFDPLNLSDYVPTDWARRAELANGRSAMLAVVGWVFPKVAGTFASTDVTTTDPIDAIMQADPQWWAQFILLCGVGEFYKYQQELEGKSFLGGAEPAADYLKLWPTDPAKQEEMRMKELKNARLAMIGIAGFAANHFIPGACPVPDFA